MMKCVWVARELSEVCVDQKRPGDFNQALMELGATVCTPKSPSCQHCPLATSCQALKKVRLTVLTHPPFYFIKFVGKPEGRRNQDKGENEEDISP